MYDTATATVTEQRDAFRACLICANCRRYTINRTVLTAQ